MPYEDDYREAAHRYRVMSEHLLQEAGPSGGWVLGFMGAGPVSEAVVASVERIRTRLARAGAEDVLIDVERRELHAVGLELADDRDEHIVLRRRRLRAKRQEVLDLDGLVGHVEHGHREPKRGSATRPGALDDPSWWASAFHASERPMFEKAQRAGRIGPCSADERIVTGTRRPAFDLESAAMDGVEGGDEHLVVGAFVGPGRSRADEDPRVSGRCRPGRHGLAPQHRSANLPDTTDRRVDGRDRQ